MKQEVREVIYHFHHAGIELIMYRTCLVLRSLGDGVFIDDLE